MDLPAAPTPSSPAMAGGPAGAPGGAASGEHGLPGYSIKGLVRECTEVWYALLGYPAYLAFIPGICFATLDDTHDARLGATARVGSENPLEVQEGAAHSPEPSGD
jgi:hypothetical protein